LNADIGLFTGVEGRLESLERPPVITMTTDFGERDGYVGTMKGVIFTLLPNAVVVDVSHQIAPQQIHEGAFILYRAYRYFPASAIHIAVVDPGVGTSRRPIALVTRHGTFIGPDNGLFTYVLRAEQGTEQSPETVNRPAWVGGMWGIAPSWAGEDTEGESTSIPEAGEIGTSPTPQSDDLPRAYHLTASDYWLSSVSNTFHGRDIFAPVAAHLASGAHVERMAEQVGLNSLVSLPVGAPRIFQTQRNTTVVGQIVYLDHFGNIITNLPDRLLNPLLEDAVATPMIEVGAYHIRGLVTSYGDVREGQALALIGSEKLLEIAVRNASAAHRMKVRIGDPVRITVDRP
jgi:hypothetical protein